MVFGRGIFPETDGFEALSRLGTDYEGSRPVDLEDDGSATDLSRTLPWDLLDGDPIDQETGEVRIADRPMSVTPGAERARELEGLDD